MDKVFVAAAGCLLEWCCGQTDQYICDEEKNVKNLELKVGTLASMRRGVEEAASTAMVKNWVSRSITFEREAKEVLSDHEAMSLPRLNLWSRYKIGKRALRKLNKARALIEEKAKLEANPEALARESGHHGRREKPIENYDKRNKELKKKAGKEREEKVSYSYRYMTAWAYESYKGGKISSYRVPSEGNSTLAWEPQNGIIVI